MEELLEILSRLKPEIDFEIETELIDRELLDSFDIVAILTAVNEEFDVKLNLGDVLPENFNDAAAIWELILEAQRGQE